MKTKKITIGGNEFEVKELNRADRVALKNLGVNILSEDGATILTTMAEVTSMGTISGPLDDLSISEEQELYFAIITLTLGVDAAEAKN